VVAVGGSYASEGTYPSGVPYVATDNFKLIKLAYDHLIESGLHRFAMFSLPHVAGSRWALERENAFRTLMQRDRMDAAIFCGCATHAATYGGRIDGASIPATNEKPAGEPRNAARSFRRKKRSGQTNRQQA